MPQTLHKTKTTTRTTVKAPSLFLAHNAGADTIVRKSTATQMFRQVAAGSAVPAGKLRALVIPDSTWKRSKDKLSPSASQAAARVAHILSVAESVWGNHNDAVEWLNSPHAELANATPYSLLRTESGGRTVESLLVALDSGFAL